jgi:hypothetical protein
MDYKILATTLACIGFSAANAQYATEFWGVSESKVGLEFIDTNRINVTGNNRNYWVVTINLKQHPERNLYTHSIRQIEVNCASNLYRVGLMVRYKTNGEADSLSPEWTPWSPVVPESTGEQKLRFVCASPEMRKSLGTYFGTGMTISRLVEIGRDIDQ